MGGGLGLVPAGRHVVPPAASALADVVEEQDASRVGATSHPIGGQAAGVDRHRRDVETDLLLRVRSALQSRRIKAQLDQALAYIEGVERANP